MASGLVKRVVDRGDIFLVVKNAIYVANASWSGAISQEVCVGGALEEDIQYFHVDSQSLAEGCLPCCGVWHATNKKERNIRVREPSENNTVICCERE